MQTLLPNNRIGRRMTSGAAVPVIVLTALMTFSARTGLCQTDPATVADLPVPGTRLEPSPPHAPVMLKGMTIHPDDPFHFDFYIESGHRHATEEQLHSESLRLIKYFLASLTLPEQDLWVNLSPSEADRIIPASLSKTLLGRDMLAQDYLLKQMTASLMYPEEELGDRFWSTVRHEARQRFGVTDIPVNTFHKVWIIPETAAVYEDGPNVYVVKSRLRVLMEEDYLARQDTDGSPTIPSPKRAADNDEYDKVTAQIVRDIILPRIEQEVNEGAHFAPLRQIYNALILSRWYKVTLKENLLSEVYVDQEKIIGVEGPDPDIKDKIYRQYIQAYKKGVFNLIREDYDDLNGQVIPRKYFSGGEEFDQIPLQSVVDAAAVEDSAVGDKYRMSVRLSPWTKSGPVSAGGLIGKYLLNGAVTVDHAASTISFPGRHLNSREGHTVTLRITGVLSGEEVLERISRINKSDLVERMRQWYTARRTAQDFYVFRRNIYGIHGLGTETVMGISEDFVDEPLALLHEIGEAMGDAGELTYWDVLAHVHDRTWFDAKLFLLKSESLQMHYALRALTRELDAGADLQLTHRIKRIGEFENEIAGRDAVAEVEAREIMAELEEKHAKIVSAKQEEREWEDMFRLDLIEFQSRWSARGNGVAQRAKEIVDFYIQHADARYPADRFAPMHLYVTGQSYPQLDKVLESVLIRLEKRLLGEDLSPRNAAYILELFSKLHTQSEIKFDDNTTRRLAARLLKRVKSVIHPVSVALADVQGIPDIEEFFQYAAPDNRQAGPPRLGRFQARIVKFLPKRLTGQHIRLYFRDDYGFRASKVRDNGTRNRLMDIFDKAHRKQTVIRHILHMITNQFDGDSGYPAWNLLVDASGDPGYSPEQRSAILSILRRKVASDFEPERVAQLIENALRLDRISPSEKHKETVRGLLSMYAGHAASHTIVRDDILAYALSDLPALLAEAGRMGRKLDAYGPRTKRDSTGEAAWTQDETLRQLRTDHYDVFIRAQQKLTILSRLTKTSQQNDPDDPFAQTTASQLIAVFVDPRWDTHIKSAVGTLLLELAEARNRQAVSFLLDMTADATEEDFFFQPSFTIEDKFKLLLDSGELDIRSAYTLIRRFRGNKDFLLGILRSTEIDIRVRLSAYTYYLQRLKQDTDGPSEEREPARTALEQLVTEIRGPLAAEAEDFLRDFARDNNAFDAMFSDPVWQDEMAKNYVTAVSLVVERHLPMLSPQSEMTLGNIVSYARFVPFMYNANSFFMLGGGMLRSHPYRGALFLQTIAHELMHVILNTEYGYPSRGLKHGIVHEALSDTLSFIISEILDLPTDARMRAVFYDHEYATVTGDDLHTVEVHEGARAQIQLLRERLEALGKSLSWEELLSAGITVIKDRHVRQRSLAEVMSIWIRTAYTQEHGRTGLQRTTFHERFYQVPATQEDPIADRVRILDEQGIDLSLGSDAAMLGRPWTLKGARRILADAENYPEKLVENAVKKVAAADEPEDHPTLEELGYERWTHLVARVHETEITMESGMGGVWGERTYDAKHLWVGPGPSDYPGDFVADNTYDIWDGGNPRQGWVVTAGHEWRKKKEDNAADQDQAQLGDVGGIDFNAVPVARYGRGVNVDPTPVTPPAFVPAFDGLVPEILQMVPVSQLLSLSADPS